MTDLIKYFQLHESSGHVFGLESARYIVVAFGPNALALFTRSKPGSIEAELIYSGTDIEGSIERDFPGERLSLDTRIVGTLAVALKKLCDSKAYSAEADEAKKNLMIKGMLLRALKLSNALRRMLFKFGYDYHDAMPRYPYATVEYIAGEKKRPLYQIDLSDFVKSLHEKLLDLDIEQDPNKFSDMANREHEAIKDICNDPYIEYPERIAHRTSEAKRYRHNYEFFKESFRQEWLNSDIADTVTSGDIIHVLASPGHTTTLDSYEDTWWSYLGLMIKKEYGRRYRVSAGKSEPEFSQLALIVESVAKEILEWGGPGADHIVPYEFSTPAAIFRHLDVFDRREIESLRSLGFVIEEYVKQTSLTKPLNLAVFGEPGSGKSFRIKQLLNSLESDQKWAFLTFNLSMFESVDSLISCFHKIQEAQLSGKMPVVFWDEFDTSLKGVPFGWLHAFLGPMQDGYYANATDEVNVRRCIFVFAGSRFKSFRDLPDPRRPDEALIPEMLCLTIEDLQNGLHDKFYSRGGGKKGRSQIGDHPGAILNQRREEWRVAKGGDFQSRLKGSLDVSEPNPDKELIIRYWKRDGRHDDPSNSDSKRKNAPVWRWDCLNYLIARARLLRNILQQKDAGYDSLFSEETRSPENSSRRGGADAEKSQHLRIDNEIAAAFIGPHIFKHGSRSVESIAQMSGLHNKVSYDRAWLPPSELIQHHVDARAFSSRTHSEDLRKLMWQEELSEWHREAKGTPLTDETKS